jgi:hypothetical protein
MNILYANVGRVLYDFGFAILDGADRVWTFLLTPLEIGTIELFGLTLIEGFSFTPLMISGGTVVALLLIGVISAVNPL